MSVLAADNLGIDFGGVKAVDGVSFAVEPGEIFAIIGPNGAGKTTLFNLISGLYQPARGNVVLNGEQITNLPAHLLARRGLSRTFQNLQVFFRMTAAENVMVGCHLQENRNVFSHLFRLPQVVAQNRKTRARAEELLTMVGLRGLAERPAGELPYGALKRLEIARALAAEPNVLLLDEPAAGCNAVETAEVDDVIRNIARQGIAVVLVEHDMKLVMKISNRIHVLDQGRTLAQGTAEEVRGNPAVVAAYLGAHAEQDHAGQEADHARH
jgi:branched-chain amino acid transport system ATP-binding protein